MKGHRLLVFLVIAILWVFSLAVVGFVVAPNTPLEQNPMGEYNSSISNSSTTLAIFEDEQGDLRIGMVWLDGEGNYRVGTYGKDNITVGFDEYGNVSASRPRRSPEFDGMIIDSIGQAFSVWAGSAKCPETELATKEIESGTGAAGSGAAGSGAAGSGAAGPG